MRNCVHLRMISPWDDPKLLCRYSLTPVYTNIDIYFDILKMCWKSTQMMYCKYGVKLIIFSTANEQSVQKYPAWEGLTTASMKTQQ